MTDFNTLEEFPAKSTSINDLEVKRWLDKFRGSYNQLQNLLLPDSEDAGFVIRTAEGNIAYRNIEGVANQIQVSNENGVDGNPVINFATPIQLPQITTQIGMTGIYQNVGGSIHTNFTSVANDGSTETALMSYTFPINFFDTDGVVIEFYAAGSYTSNANNKTIRFYFDGTTQYDSGAVAVNTSGNTWSMNGQIIRRSSTNAYVHVRALYSFSSPGDSASLTDEACDFSNEISLYFTGTGDASNDITQDILILRYYGAAS